MYGENNQYQQFNNMPYDNTGVQPAAPQDNRQAGNGPEKPESRKKKDSVWRKLGVSAACALVFGCVAGVTMTGVTKMTGTSQTSAVVSESTAAETEAADEAAVRALTETGAETEAPKKAEASAVAESIAPGAVLDVSAIVEKAMPSVVAIDVRGEQSYTSIFGYSQKYETEGAGSGILIGENDEEYLIVTNNHVVENTKSMSVQFIDGESVEAELKGTDSGKDVAVISVKKENVKDSTKGAIALAEIGDSDSLKVGQGVIAIGNALGYGQSVTVGYISALNRTITAMDSTTGQNAKVENLLQTDAAINPGNSGGALLDMDGRVIGINESKSVDTTVEGMGYAIPISSVTKLIDTLSSQKTRSKVAEENRGYLGIQGQNVDSDAAQRFSMPIGIFVYRILEGSAAADSGLQESDIITKLDGMTVSTIEELQEKLTHFEKGETVTLTVQRPNGSEYNELQIEIRLGARETLDAASGDQQQKEAEPETEEAKPEEGNNNGNGFGGLDGWEDFFRNGGFQFRW